MLELLQSLRKKTCLLCLFLLAALFCPNAFAQKNLSEIKLSIDAKDLPLSEVLELISKKSNIPFSYNPKKIPASKKITYKAVNKSLSTILDEVSKLFELKYVMVENQIILKPDKKTDKPTIQTYTFSGNIKDEKSGEALIGASIQIKESKIGTITNAFGFFSITLPKGTYNISSSFIGYKEFFSTVDLNTSVKLEIKLLEEPPVLQEIVVSGNVTDLVSEIKSAAINFRPTVVEQRPAFLGEMDVVKSLESVPGIKFHADGSTFYYVRGGNRDQNLLLVDDAPIYNPSHMLGIFSTIIPDAVSDITLYKGDMPASLGGRLSSVLEVRTKKGNDQHFHVWGSAGLISSKLGAEGPIKKNASSFLVSARASSLGIFVQLADKNIKQFNFYDLTGKVNFKLNHANRIFFSSYTGGDNYFSSNAGISWSNVAGTLRWNHLFTDRLFLNTTLALSSYDYSLFTDVANETKWGSHIGNLALKSDFSYFIKPQHELLFGWNINAYNFNPGNVSSNAQLPPSPSLSVKNATELVLYGNHEIKLGDHLGLNYGVRISSWRNTGEAFEFIYDENRKPIDTINYKKGETYKTRIFIEPRITLTYLLNEQSSIKTSYSHNVQNVHLISNSVSPFTSLEVWLPTSTNIKPESSNQITLGYYRSLSNTGTTLSAEGFYKKMHNQIDYNGHAEIYLNPLLERELQFGKATAYGIELLAKKDEGRVHGLLGYTYARSKRKFENINQGISYNAFSDRPHQVNMTLAYDVTLRLNIGMNWNYTTGSPYSAPVSFYMYNGEEVPVYGQKNNARLRDYHRMDLSANYKLNKNTERRYNHSLSFSIFNVYGRRNALFINYNKTETESGDFKIPTNLMNANRTTSQLYLFRFTPSFSYNFKF